MYTIIYVASGMETSSNTIDVTKCLLGGFKNTLYKCNPHH